MRQEKESSKFKLFCFREGKGWAGRAYDGEMHLFPMHRISVPPCCVSFGVLRRVVVTWLIREKSEGEGVVLLGRGCQMGNVGEARARHRCLQMQSGHLMRLDSPWDVR
jgi:hypothetical protein